MDPELRGPRFDRPVPHGGYHWHYVDGVSDDGAYAIVIIALLGNPFSPDYFRARERGAADALSFSSMNVALYGRRASAWALQEHGVFATDRAATSLCIGTSAMRWVGDRLVVDIDERTTPWDRRLRGHVVVHPETRPGVELTIDAEGRHRWWPVAPLARIEVDFTHPGLRFNGHGYHDANAGDAPLESAFERWSWSRARAGKSALITYDVTGVGGDEERSLALRFRPDGSSEELENTWRASLPTSRWQLARRARVDAGTSARLVTSLEDGPFYTRSLIDTQLDGCRVIAVHEELAAHRLLDPTVRMLTRYRMRTLQSREMCRTPR